MTTTSEQAERRGAEAFRKGRQGTGKENPYQTVRLRSLWFKGYRDAKAKAEQENKS